MRFTCSISRYLEGILTDLHAYHSQQQQWVRLQERLLWEQSAFNIKLDHVGGFKTDKLDILSGKRVQRCVQKTAENSKQIISCNFYNQGPSFDTLNLQNLFNYVENEKKKLNEQMSRSNRMINEKNDLKKKFVIGKTPPVLYPKFPTTMSTSSNQYFDATGWPSKEECLKWNLPVEEKDDLDLPVFLPPENKGFQCVNHYNNMLYLYYNLIFRIKRILSEYIGLNDGSQHELPWYPPVCEHPSASGEKYVPPNERQSLNNFIKSNSFLRNYLLQYVNDGKADEAEIGQRIITAMEKVLTFDLNILVLIVWIRRKVHHNGF